MIVEEEQPVSNVERPSEMATCRRLMTQAMPRIDRRKSRFEVA
jgi:hypothetical protein